MRFILYRTSMAKNPRFKSQDPRHHRRVAATHARHAPLRGARHHLAEWTTHDHERKQALASEARGEHHPTVIPAKRVASVARQLVAGPPVRADDVGLRARDGLADLDGGLEELLWRPLEGEARRPVLT